MFTEHHPHVTVISHERSWIVPERTLFKDRPILNIITRSSVSPATAGSPLLPIIWNPRGRTVEYIGKALLTPNFPLTRTPALSIEGLFYELFGLRAVAPVAEVQTS